MHWFSHGSNEKIAQVIKAIESLKAQVSNVEDNNSKLNEKCNKSDELELLKNRLANLEDNNTRLNDNCIKSDEIIESLKYKLTNIEEVLNQNASDDHDLQITTQAAQNDSHMNLRKEILQIADVFENRLVVLERSVTGTDTKVRQLEETASKNVPETSRLPDGKTASVKSTKTELATKSTTSDDVDKRIKDIKFNAAKFPAMEKMIRDLQLRTSKIESSYAGSASKTTLTTSMKNVESRLSRLEVSISSVPKKCASHDALKAAENRITKLEISCGLKQLNALQSKVTQGKNQGTRVERKMLTFEGAVEQRLLTFDETVERRLLSFTEAMKAMKSQLSNVEDSVKTLGQEVSENKNALNIQAEAAVRRQDHSKSMMIFKHQLMRFQMESAQRELDQTRWFYTLFSHTTSSCNAARPTTIPAPAQHQQPRPSSFVPPPPAQHQQPSQSSLVPPPPAQHQQPSQSSFVPLPPAQHQQPSQSSFVPPPPPTTQHQQTRQSSFVPPPPPPPPPTPRATPPAAAAPAASRPLPPPPPTPPTTSAATAAPAKPNAPMPKYYITPELIAQCKLKKVPGARPRTGLGDRSEPDQSDADQSDADQSDADGRDRESAGRS